jgi:hypothetical protein
VFQSHVIEINGVFAGAAVTAGGAFRFKAVSPLVEELDGSQWQTLAAMRRAVAHLFVTGRLPGRRPGVAELTGS